MKSEEVDNKITENAVEILKQARSVEMQLVLYEERYNAIPNIKQLIFKLRETANFISDEVMDSGRNMPILQTSDMMPCQMCNDHYDVASEHVKGIRWEPVPGKGFVYICWECATKLAGVLNRQLVGLSYTFLFSKGTEELRNKDLMEIEEAREDVAKVEEEVNSDVAYSRVTEVSASAVYRLCDGTSIYRRSVDSEDDTDNRGKMINKIEKHDGNLGHNATIFYSNIPYLTKDNDVFHSEEVKISDKRNCVTITAKEALSLIQWLEQEKPMLEKLAEEQSTEEIEEVK